VGEIVLLGVRMFVLLVFAAIGASFIAIGAALVVEFGGADIFDRKSIWLALATLNSHLFLFFPTLGLLTLFAFYAPACVFVDLYWRHVPYGRLRFLLGAVVLLAATWAISTGLREGTPAIWQIAPAVLEADRGKPERCAPLQRPGPEICPTCAVEREPPREVCVGRQPILKAVSEIREVSKQSFGLGLYARNCRPAGLLEPDLDREAARYCFASGTKLDADACCAAQQRFDADLFQLYAAPERRSLTDRVHSLTLPVIVFFMLILLVMGGLLIARRHAVDRYYFDMVLKVERGVLFGAFIMIIWPFTNHAFIESSATLYGPGNRSTYIEFAPFFSALFGLWALMILFYFYRKSEKDVEATGRAFGVIASLVTVLNYSEIVRYSERFIGSGASWESLTFLVLLILIIASRLTFWKSSDRFG
jgi:hypothetical protein